MNPYKNIPFLRRINFRFCTKPPCILYETLYSVYKIKKSKSVIRVFALYRRAGYMCGRL